MSAYLFPGVLGLLVGLLLHWAGFDRREGLQNALGLRRSLALRSGLTAVGWAMALTAFLCWLAVIDVDTIVVLPLSAGALLGGTLLGVAAGLCGFTPWTAFAGLSHAPLEALCTLAGCGAAALLLPALEEPLSPLREAAPFARATLFQVTLDEPFLLGGPGFLGQACAGAVLIAIAICIPSPRPVILSEEVIAQRASETAAPEDAAEETLVAILPGEEPLIVDTALDEEPSAEAAPDEETDQEEEPLPEEGPLPEEAPLPKEAPLPEEGPLPEEPDDPEEEESSPEG